MDTAYGTLGSAGFDLQKSREQLLFTNIVKAMKRRGWEIDWLTFDLEKKILDIEHESITKKEAMNFYDEIFSIPGIEEILIEEDPSDAPEEAINFYIDDE